MFLVTDIGNTATKAAVFQENKLVEKFHFSTPSIDNFAPLFSEFPIKAAIISNVASANPSFTEWLGSQCLLHLLTSGSRLPFMNQYATPSSLGTDRIAAVAGAAVLFPETNCLVIDAGTCIKTDFIDNKGIYHGGSISPGINLRYKAMNDYTARLPLLTATAMPQHHTGNSTETSLNSGVMFGITGEINHFSELYLQQYPDLKIILTGGDGRFFEAALKKPIFASPDLTLIGLNKILELNVVSS